MGDPHEQALAAYSHIVQNLPVTVHLSCLHAQVNRNSRSNWGELAPLNSRIIRGIFMLQFILLKWTTVFSLVFRELCWVARKGASSPPSADRPWPPGPWLLTSAWAAPAAPTGRGSWSRSRARPPSSTWTPSCGRCNTRTRHSHSFTQNKSYSLGLDQK